MADDNASAEMAGLSLSEASLVECENGEMVWKAQRGNTQEPAGHLKEEEIVFVLKPQGNDHRYFIYSLAETEGDDGALFKLSAVATPALPAQLEKYLLLLPPIHLLSDSSKQLHVIISTRSGLGKAPVFWDNVLQPLLAALNLRERTSSAVPETGPNQEDGYLVVNTQNSQSVRDFAHGLHKAKTKNTIILLSGDGGIVDVLNGLDETQDPSLDNTVALLPLGTGNALFHSLHKPHYLAKAKPVPSSFVLGLRTLFKGSTAHLPAFKASFSTGSRLVTYTDPSGNAASEDTNAESLQEKTKSVSHLLGAIVASYGFHASLVWESDTPDYRRHGAKRFGMAAQELLKLGHSYAVRVEARLAGGLGEWTEFTPGERFNYVLATLVSNLEKTFTISPAGRPLDGQLRLVHFGDVGGERTMQIMMAAYQEGSHMDLKWGGEDGKPEQRVRYEAIEALRVSILEEDPRWRKVCIDGTIVEIPEGGWMEVKREQSQLRVLVDKFEV